jgi:hypothetical protein
MLFFGQLRLRSGDDPEGSRKMLLHGLGARPAEFNRPSLTKEKKFRA